MDIRMVQTIRAFVYFFQNVIETSVDHTMEFNSLISNYEVHTKAESYKSEVRKDCGRSVVCELLPVV